MTNHPPTDARAIVWIVLGAAAAGVAVWAVSTYVVEAPASLPLLLATSLTVVATFGLTRGLRVGAAATDWVPPHARRRPALGVDPRFSRLARSFVDGTDKEWVATRIQQTLVEVVDARLAADHGIRRAEDPGAARAVLGDELADYLDQPPRHRRGYLARMSRILTRIESL